MVKRIGQQQNNTECRSQKAGRNLTIIDSVYHWSSLIFSPISFYICCSFARNISHTHMPSSLPLLLPFQSKFEFCFFMKAFPVTFDQMKIPICSYSTWVSVYFFYLMSFFFFLENCKFSGSTVRSHLSFALFPVPTLVRNYQINIAESVGEQLRRKWRGKEGKKRRQKNPVSQGPLLGPHLDSWGRMSSRASIANGIPFLSILQTSYKPCIPFLLFNLQLFLCYSQFA